MSKAEAASAEKSQSTKSGKRLVVLFYLLTAYILLQFAWWAYLLIDLNKKYYFDEGTEAVRLKVLMVAGEGTVFLIFLLTGIYIMQRTVRKEISLVRQQRNFLLSVTHELKTPVAVIKLCLQTLQKRAGLPSEKRLTLESTAVENTERLHNLIDNVLLATRIESGQDVVQKQSIDLSELAERLCGGLLKAIAGRTELHVEIEKGITAEVDPQAFESILVNLTENAVKYAGKSPVAISLASQPDGIRLRVSDFGPGIPPDQTKKVFNKN
jgi:signal transduction histidine kinase